MVIEDEQPFCFGEKSGLRKFMAKACPRFQLPSRRTCTRDIVRCYFQEKAKLKKFFKDSCQRVCLTTDCWTSQQQDGYMTVTASFIDDNWKMHKKVIGFFMVKGHKGDDIGKNVIRCMTEWGLERVMTITVDNASTNDTGIGYLRRQLSGTNIANGKYLHMRCAAHIVNLIVQDGLKELDLSVKRVRAAIRYIRNGGSRIAKFKELIGEEKLTNKPFLKLDVPTRWNSTCIMLKAAIVYEKVFTRLVDEDMSYVIDLSEARDGFGHPDETDWENVKKMADFLEHFHDLTVRVSATLHVTSHTFFHEIGEVHLLIQSWLNSTDVVQSAMGRRMKDKFDKYWGLWHTSNSNTIVNDRRRGKGKEKENINLLIFVAGCLDPRYKLSMYTKITVEEIFGEERGQIVWEAIDTCVHELFEEYKKMYGPTEETSDAIDPVASKGGRGGKLKEVIAKRMRLGNASSNNTKSELDKYLAKETEETEMKIDLLVWWKASEQRFPILSRLARDVLAIPISSVASESAFSTSGRILDDFRISLTPFMLEALVCTQDWLRWSVPVDIEENIEELTMMEQELIEEFGAKEKGKQ
ncbi:zinc finger BED domain-containing protein RICESLEEPER 2-like [Panicum hallii]|uniref:zinc finger BED domain-containing protein RICESLEEPER 2-like n=1 Tax=Panicum hallii TaxID=206008 RepID=UPI000DF4E571|nr:zinc finger BED domain-containing protein RICESLEEPER 2-like [Panicum hallii]